ncbi:MAG: hypothetical protein ACSHX6_15175 [Akkermansiaceae bacterium]
MSEEKNNQAKTDPAATQPIKKTSAVPLRKETVRVTLKAPGAKPGGAPAGVESSAPAPAPTMKLGNVAPPRPLSAAPTIPLGAPVAPPSAPKANLPDATSAVPLKQETMRVTLKADKDGNPAGGAPAAPAPAPTIPLGGGAPKPPTPASPAPTMKLGGAPTVPLATQPLNAPLGGGGASQPLPKATVELQQTQQLTQGLGAPTQAATIQTVSEGDEASRGGTGAALPLTIVAFVLSLIVLYFQFSHAKIWVDEHKDGDTMSIFESAE